MTIKVRYFASIREALGVGEEVALLPSVAALRDHLIASSPAHAQALARGKALRCALNQALTEESQALRDGDEVAFFPPVTGG